MKILNKLWTQNRLVFLDIPEKCQLKTAGTSIDAESSIEKAEAIIKKLENFDGKSKMLDLTSCEAINDFADLMRNLDWMKKNYTDLEDPILTKDLLVIFASEVALYMAFCENYRVFKMREREWRELEENPTKIDEASQLKRKMLFAREGMLSSVLSLKKIKPQLKNIYSQIVNQWDTIDTHKSAISRTPIQKDALELFQRNIKNLKSVELHAYGSRISQLIQQSDDMHPEDQKEYDNYFRKLQTIQNFFDSVTDEVRGNVALFYPWFSRALGRFLRYKDAPMDKSNPLWQEFEIDTKGAGTSSGTSVAVSMFLDQINARDSFAIGTLKKMQKFKVIATYVDLLPQYGGKEFFEIVFADLEKQKILVKLLRREILNWDEKARKK